MPAKSLVNGDPVSRVEVVVPSDTVDLVQNSRGLFVGVAGDVAVILIGETTATTFKNIPSGHILPFCVKRVMATNTTATYMVALR